MDSAAIICRRIRDVENTTQYQRASVLTQEYQVQFIIQSNISELPSELVEKSDGVSSYPRFLPNISVIFSLWALLLVMYKNRESKIDFVYTTHQPRFILSGYLLQIIGFMWVSEIYDYPLLGIDIALSKGIKNEYNLYNKLNAKLVTYALNSPPDLMILALHEEVLEKSKIFPNKSDINLLNVTNGVSLDLIKTVKSELDPVQKGQFVITYIGPVDKSRNIEKIIDAAKILHKNGLDFRMNLIGTVSDENYINNSISSTKTKVRVLGEVKHKQALEEIYLSNVCLCTLGDLQNHRYAYPIKLFEYMSFGKAIIASRYPGISQVIHHMENGILIQQGDYKQLAKELLRLYNHPQLRDSLGEQAARDAEVYNWGDINRQVVNSIEDLTQSNDD